MNIVSGAMRCPITVLVAIVAIVLASVMAVRQMPRDDFLSSRELDPAERLRQAQFFPDSGVMLDDHAEYLRAI